VYNAQLVELVYGGRTITVAGPFLGAPQAVLILEKLIALGSRAIVVLGWCGSLQPHVRIGDWLLPSGAHSEEGTSAHYPLDSGECLPDSALCASLQNYFTQSGLSVHSGLIWTTDAPLRETVTKVRDYGAKGLLAVEMEMSALFRVASYRNVGLVGLLVVSDELFTLKWRPGFQSDRFKRSCRLAAEAILEFCATLPANLLE
jgi:uridine phosphorylase